MLIFLLSGGRIEILGNKQLTNKGNCKVLVRCKNNYYVNKKIVLDIFIQFTKVNDLPKNSNKRKLDLNNYRFLEEE